jgi:hypothetical protein
VAAFPPSARRRPSTARPARRAGEQCSSLRLGR